MIKNLMQPIYYEEYEVIYKEKYEKFLEQKNTYLIFKTSTTTITLLDLIKERKKNNLFYKEKEIIYFYFLFLNILLDLHSKNHYHLNF